jgi:protoporphyrinogen oxidase
LTKSIPTPGRDGQKKSIAIVGGGMTGIAAALRLANSGRFSVSLFEKRDRLGGLSDSYQWHDVVWDRFYHVILSTDTRLVDFVKMLGLERDLFWQDTRTGFYGRGKLVSMSTTLDFVRFPFMSPWQKFRMGLGILYSMRIKDPSRLDRLYVRAWLTRVFGRRVYESIWEPLLRSKLGSAREKTSAAFIWATITRLYGTRQGKDKKEKMGHVKGGYRSILAAAERLLREDGVSIHTNEAVTALETDGTIKSLPAIVAGQKKYSFDKILFTMDCPTILDIVSPLHAHPYWDAMKLVSYLGICCVMLILDRNLSTYYVINLLDKSLPFTGIIEATNVVSPTQVAGRHIIYLPKYAPAGDPIWSLTDDEVLDQFVGSLKRVFPDLRETHILHRVLFRERYVQPLQELGALDRTLGHATPFSNVFIANTSMLTNTTLNNNAAISLAQKVTNEILSEAN